ncbi:peptide MFS transporter [Pelomicrobium sp. G1]|uniref:peptide MFS transporter n=1 Tax=unclassified Pelomicrobium TaxID=2815318 RepID=UPI003F7679A0
MPAPPSFPSGAAPARHPPGLALLFVTEMWERFSYYGMRAILVLFLIAAPEAGGFGWSVEQASRLYGWYTGLVYLTPVIGGYLADRWLGTHRALVAGGSIIAAGHFCLALETLASFYLGLALIIAGTGLFKSNVSTMVGQLYGPEDPRRDSAFTLFYMGINLGGLAGSLVCGYLAESPRFGWRYGFAAAGVGMVLGLAAYLAGRPRWLGDVGDRPARAVAVSAARAPSGPEDRHRVLALCLTSLFVVFFWMAYEQAGSSMTVFAERSTDRSIPEWLAPLVPLTSIPAAWFQALNPAFILVLAPVASVLWRRLDGSGRGPSTPMKMALGLFFLGAGFAVLAVGTAGGGPGLVGPGWLVAAYLLHTLGELCLSPVGLSMVTRLAPVRFASMLMGVWFLSNFAANLIGGYLAGMLERVASGEYFRLLGGQADFFLIFVVTSLGAGLALAALSPCLRRLGHGRL